ncbi:MAG TPA: DUF4097 family beta strand repeat-containing protein, partial [Rhodanobacteraceae bacterium]
TLTNTQHVPVGTRVEVENLLGHITVKQGGPTFSVTATVVAGGKNQQAAQALADLVGIRVRHDHDGMVIHVHYPTDQYTSYQYVLPKGAEANKHAIHFLGMTFHGSSSISSMKYQRTHVTVYQGHDKGVPLHVDLVVSMPVDSHAKIDNRVGAIKAADLKGSLSLENDSGDITASRVSGQLQIDVDSGDTLASDITGPLKIESDSGDVTVKAVNGTTTVKADSGDIRATRLDGDQLELDSDSGDIVVSGASGTLHADADSGDVRIDGLGTVPYLKAKSDSGDIHVSGNLAGVASFKLASDSGDVTLTSSQPPAVHLDISATDIRVNWPGVRNMQSRDGHYSADIGAATGQGRISTDSGDVTLTR